MHTVSPVLLKLTYCNDSTCDMYKRCMGTKHNLQYLDVIALLIDEICHKHCIGFVAHCTVLGFMCATVCYHNRISSCPQAHSQNRKGERLVRAPLKQLRNPLNSVTTRASRRQLRTLIFLYLHCNATFSLIPILKRSSQ